MLRPARVVAALALGQLAEPRVVRLAERAAALLVEEAEQLADRGAGPPLEKVVAQRPGLVPHQAAAVVASLLPTPTPALLSQTLT